MTKAGPSGQGQLKGSDSDDGAEKRGKEREGKGLVHWTCKRIVHTENSLCVRPS